jgi:phospholipid/cholesterol/gamma-HCH transport system substrate-binding protein
MDEAPSEFKEAWEKFTHAMRIPVMFLFAAGCFGLLLFLWMSFGGSVPLKANKYELRVSFPEAATLAEAADVRIAGVTIGKVRRKDLDKGGNRTRVILDINRRYAPLPKDTRAILRQKTLLGETFVELTPGHPSKGTLADHAILPNAQVEPTVELDEILRIFDPKTKAAFRDWVQESAYQMKGTAPEDLNDALGNLANFASDGSTLLKVLDEQHVAVRQLVKNTGVVFGALNERKGQLRQLVVNSERTFSATASQDQALADTFQVFPVFLDESRATADRLERFSRNTQPLVRALKPVADNLGPTVRDLGALSPDLESLFVHLKPVIREAPRTLPEASRFLRGASPVVDALHVFLPELNPVLSFFNFDQNVIAHFLTDGAFALNHRINNDPQSHVLPQFGIVNGKSLSFSSSVPPWARGNAYVAPNMYDRAIPLGMYESFDCSNAGGKKRDPTDKGSPVGDELPPCFQQPPLLYDNRQYPLLDQKGEISRKDPPTYSLSGNTPANPDTHR